jgi:hypothetical protein
MERLRYNEKIVEIPQWQSGGKSFLQPAGNRDNKEADEALYHVHASRGLSMEHICYSILKRLDFLLEAAQM